MSEEGLCGCGCGEPAPLSKYNDAPRGYVKGKSMRFILGHNAANEPFEEDAAMNCWVWKGAMNRDGYGRMVIDGRRVIAHRGFYERYFAPIPEGLTIDHLCNNRACVNPGHMEPVTRAENTHRACQRRDEAVAAVARVREWAESDHPTPTGGGFKREQGFHSGGYRAAARHVLSLLDSEKGKGA